MLVEKVEVGSPGAFEEAGTFPEIVDALLATLANDVPVEFTEQERAWAVEYMREVTEKLTRFIASCAAKEVNPASRLDPSQIDRKRIAPQTTQRQRHGKINTSKIDAVAPSWYWLR